jgi:hypothetical protein
MQFLVCILKSLNMIDRLIVIHMYPRCVALEREREGGGYIDLSFIHMHPRYVQRERSRERERDLTPAYPDKFIHSSCDCLTYRQAKTIIVMWWLLFDNQYVYNTLPTSTASPTASEFLWNSVETTVFSYSSVFKHNILKQPRGDFVYIHCFKPEVS